MHLKKLSWVALPAIIAFVLSVPLHAAEEHDHDHGGHEHHEAKYGGIVEEANGLDYELVLKPDLVRLYVDAHDKKLSVKGGKATVTLLRGGETTKIVLLPAGENWFEAKAAAPTGPGVRAIAVVLLKGKTTSVRFAVK